MANLDRRRRELAKIHIGAKQLCGSDREAYEDMLEAVTGARSSKGLDQARRTKVLRHLRACGAKFRSAKRRRPAVAPEKALLIRKIDALLIDAGDRPRSYAEAILQRMTRHSHRSPLEWATPPQLVRIVQALEIEKRRRERRKGEAA